MDLARLPAYVVIASMILLLTSCGQAPPGPPPEKRVETTKVTGEVYVDGKPAERLQVRAIPTADLGVGRIATGISGTTDADGKFSLHMYDINSGIPAGEYALTFTWRSWDMLQRKFAGPDQLNGRYESVENSPKKFTVENGKAVDLGKIELTTQ